MYQEPVRKKQCRLHLNYLEYGNNKKQNYKVG